MIIIENPFIRTIEESTFLVARIIDEKAGIDEECFYRTEIKYGEFFCPEVADCFVVGMLLPALQSNQDIVVKSTISEKLSYNLKHTVIYTLSKAFGYKEISIKADSIINYKSRTNFIGTGCSLGIDSLSTIFQHTDKNCPKSFRLTHLTYFNVGAMGSNDLKSANESFLRDLPKIKDFANEVGLPLITLESNFPLYYNNYDFDFDSSGVIRNISAVLSLQNGFLKYIYSSDYPLSETYISSENLAHMNAMLLSALSTENTEIIIGSPNLSRSERTKIVINSNLSKKYLHVCNKDVIVNDKLFNPFLDVSYSKTLNCSTCEKCLRTLITLDILNKTDDFNQVFNIQKFKRIKIMYLAIVIGNRKRNSYYQDIFDLANSEKYRIPLISNILSLGYYLKLNLFVKELIKMFRKRV